MPVTAGSAVTAFARSLAVGSFVAGAGRATFVLGVAAAVALLGCRLAGSPPQPEPWWTAALVPILAAGWWQLRRARLPAGIAAAHLDQRLGLNGLLLTAWENGGVDTCWQQPLQEGLASWQKARPAIRWRELTLQPLLALGLLACVALWPERAPGRLPAAAPGAFAAAAAGAREQLAAAATAGALAPDLLATLGGKLAELVQRAAPDDPSSWRELDALVGQIAREQLLASLDPARRSRGSGDRSGEAGRAAAVAQAIEAMRSFATDERLPAMARGLLQAALGTVGDDLGRLMQDPQRLRELAAKFAGVAANFAGALESLGLSPQDQSSMRELAATLQQNAAAVDRGARGATEDARGGDAAPGATAGTGRSVGPESAAAPGSPNASVRHFLAKATGAAAKDFELPAGQTAPEQWLPMGAAGSEPTVAAVPGEARGGEPVRATGGASWQLRLAPHHRRVVQRFFASGETKAPERR